eukprot:gene34739-19833_t
MRACRRRDAQHPTLPTTATEVVLLARVAARLPSLRELNVAGNPFGCLGGKALLEALEANTCITRFDATGVQFVTGLRRKIDERLRLNERLAAGSPPAAPAP